MAWGEGGSGGWSGGQGGTGIWSDGEGEIRGGIPQPQPPAATPAASTAPNTNQQLLDAIDALMKAGGYEAITKEQQAAAEAGLGGISTNMGNVAGTLQQYGLGQQIDPRFQSFRNSRMNALDFAQQQQQARQSEFFTRRGMAGGSAALNQQNKLAQEFGMQGQQVMSEIGMAEMANQNQQLMQAMGLNAQQAGIIQQILGVQEAGATSRNSAQTANIETLSIPEQLRIAMLAAQNAGKTGSSGGSGGLLGFLGL